MTAPVATSELRFDRSAFFFHLTEPTCPDEPCQKLSNKGSGEDATARLHHLAELVVSECVSSETLRSAFQETTMAFAQRITTRVRQRRAPDDRDFASLRLLDCALEARERGQTTYVVRQVWLALSLYHAK